MMLHAWRLAFDHPVTGERMEFTAPIPPEFRPWLPEGGEGEVGFEI
jgi:23S rRNA pseudouridine1911/1915/1917 synthase